MNQIRGKKMFLGQTPKPTTATWRTECDTNLSLTRGSRSRAGGGGSTLLAHTLSRAVIYMGFLSPLKLWPLVVKSSHQEPNN